LYCRTLQGGVAYMSGGTATFTSCTFSGNSAVRPRNLCSIPRSIGSLACVAGIGYCVRRGARQAGAAALWRAGTLVRAERALPLRAVRVLRGKRRLGLGTAPAGDCAARAKSDARFGLVWRVQEVRAPPPARARRCGPRAGQALRATGAFAWMRRGVAHAASRWLRRCGPRGCARLAGSAAIGFGRLRGASRG
jgi:hypothetical protein